MTLFRHCESLLENPLPLADDLDLPFGGLPAAEDEALNAALYLGAITTRQRGLAGPLTLELMLSPDGRSLEIGPFCLDRGQVVRLKQLLEIATALLARPAPPAESGRGIAGWDLARNPTGRATVPPWEGETLP